MQFLTVNRVSNWGTILSSYTIESLILTCPHCIVFLLAFSQILGIINLDMMMCPIHVRNFSHFWVKVSHWIWVWVSWQAEFSYHAFFIITHKISHISCICTCWNFQNCPTQTILNLNITFAKINEQGFIFNTSYID